MLRRYMKFSLTWLPEIVNVTLCSVQNPLCSIRSIRLPFLNHGFGTPKHLPRFAEKTNVLGAQRQLSFRLPGIESVTIRPPAVRRIASFNTALIKMPNRLDSAAPFARPILPIASST